MAYIDKINVNGTNYDLGVMESLKDANGHNRFIEGNPTSNLSNTGLTIDYAKWSLSGTHLMIVFAFSNNTGSDIVLNAWTVLFAISLEQWVRSKIYPLGNSGIIMISDIKVLNPSNYTITSNGNIYLNAIAGGYNCVLPSSTTIASGNICRVQFDLIIDMD